MNGQENTPANTLLCANGCGFYGSPTTKNLCSKCYRDLLRGEKQQQEQQMKQQHAEAVIRSVTKSPAPEPSEEPQDVEMSTTTSPPLSDQPFISLPLLSSSTISSSDTTTTLQTIAPSFSSSASGSSEPIPPPVSSSSSPAPEVSIHTETADNIATTTTTIASTIQAHTLLSVPLLSGASISAPGSETASSIEDDEAPSRPVQKNKGRCFQCNKKVGLLGFQCRCGYNFCGSHRHADQHSCQFNYRELARQQLSKANQKVVADKLNRI